MRRTRVIAYALLCVTGLFIYAGNPLFWSLASSFRTGAAGAATIALINTIAQFGGLVGPWSIGLVRSATGNFKLALLTIAAFLVRGDRHCPGDARETHGKTNSMRCPPATPLRDIFIKP